MCIELICKEIDKFYFDPTNLPILKMQEPILSPLEVFYHWEKTTPDNIFLKQPIEGQWRIWTYRKAGDEIRRIAASLKAYGLEPRSNIAILSKNCSHWIMADLAIWMAGHVSVPLYPTLSAPTIRQILEHSDSKILFVGKLDDFAAQKPGIPSRIKCISFTPFGEKEGDQWDDLLVKHQPVEEGAHWQLQELATIKYTSGTTGNPKGAMFTLEALGYVVRNGFQGFNLPKQPHRFFSYLPLSHVAERMLVELGGLYCGATIHFSESLEKFPHNLMEVQPTVFLAVPRIWAKFREKIEEKMPKLDILLKIPVISAVIKKAIRKKLGLSKAILILTGAAPVSAELLKWFDRLGITIQEVYGLTENLAYSHINLNEIKFGTVGKAWPDVFVKFSDEGEIQMKHPGLMSGYYREPELSAAAFTRDGFLKTGDKGEVDAEGFLTITGRIKDQFKTDKAKFVDPAPIELKLLMNADIEQVCVVGMGIPQPIALTVLSASARNKSKELVMESIAKTIDALNPHLESYERIKAAVILKGDWTIDNGLMTPTLKVKRNEVEKIHLPKYPEWYKKNEMVIWE
jgi:long-chain acyl-CoA synthetase